MQLCCLYAIMLILNQLKANTMNKQIINRILTYGTIPLFFVLLSAQEIEEKELSPITTKAKKESEQNHQYANTNTFNAQSIQEHQATDLRNVFITDSSISVGGANTTSQKVYIRGLEDRLFNVSLDSASQFGNIFHHQGNILIDPMMLKNIKISKGISDFSLGFGGLAGSISINTKDAKDFLRPNQKFGAILGASGYTNQGYRANITSYFALDKTDGLLYLNQTNILGFYDGNGDKVTGSNSDNKSILLKLNQQIAQNDKISFSYSYLNENSNAPFATNLSSKNLALYSHKNQNHTASLSYEHKGLDSAPSIKSNLFFNQRALNLTPLESAGSSENSEASAKDIAFSNFGYNLGLKHNFEGIFSALEYGLNYQGMFVEDSLAKISAINRAKESANVYGGFLKGEFLFLENLIFNTQARYDMFDYFDKNAQNHLTHGPSASISLTYFPIDSLSLRAAYGYITSGALPGDATLLSDSNATIDKNLKAQSAQNLEFDIDYGLKHWCFRLALYYSILHNFINSYASDGHDHSQADHTHTAIRKNMQDNILIPGYEGGIGFNYGEFDSYVSIAQSFPTYKGYLLQDTYELGAVSGITYNLALSYYFKKIFLKISWVSQFVQKLDYTGYDIYNDEVGEISKDGYSVHNLYISWNGHKRWRFGLSINNIFNTFYIAQTSPFKSEAMENLANSSLKMAMANPGIDVRFELSYKF